MANTTNTCVINISFTKASTRSNIVSGDNLSNACGKIAKYLETSAGEIVAGKSYVISGTGYIAGDGAEVFNNYTNNKAVGNYSHAEGNNTIALGNNSHAEGQNSKALGVCSHAEGNNTTAKGQSQHVEGEYNVIDESVSSDNSRGTFAHIIGNGTSDSNRSNAYAIDWDGKIYVNNAETGVDVSTLPKQVKLSTGSAIDPDSDKVITIPASDSVSTTSSTTVATSTAVKTAYDEGVTALNYAADTGVKNLVEYNLTVPIELTATVNADGSITVTANTTNVRRLTISTDLSRLEDGKSYILSGCTGGNADTTYHLGITKNNYAGIVYQTNNEVSFTKTSEMTLLVLTVRSGQQWTKTFYPMIREATITSSSFRPYAPSNSELYSMIGDINSVLEGVL